LDPWLYELWCDFFSRETTFISPVLRESETVGTRFPVKLTENGTETPNWSGVVVIPTPGKPIRKAVVGRWEVATAQNVDNAGDRYSQWLGTGGWSDDPDDTLLQAGVAGVIDAFGVAHYYPWWEWTSRKVTVLEVMIRDFPISPGDIIQVNIWLFSDRTANIAISGGDYSVLISVDGSESGFRLKGGSSWNDRQLTTSTPRWLITVIRSSRTRWRGLTMASHCSQDPVSRSR
jgi:hypothetical protein